MIGPYGRTIVAQARLGVLLHLDENITEDGLKDFPLAKYGAKHWVDHVRFESVPSKVQNGMKHLFDPSKHHFRSCSARPVLDELVLSGKLFEVGVALDTRHG